MPDADNSQTSDSAQQKRFIRTFAGDAATIQSGGTPDLQPLDPVAPAAPSPVFMPPPEPAAPTPPARTPSIPAPQKVVDEDKEAILARLRAKVAASSGPTTEPVAPQARAPEPVSDLPTASPIHTYASDFSDNIKNKSASTASILAAEQDAGPAPTGPQSEKSSLSGILFFVSGVGLLALGGGGAYFAYQAYQGRSLPVVIAPTVSAPIFVDERAEISGTSTVLMQAIEQSVATPLSSDGVRFLYTATATSTDQSVFSALQLGAPGLLLRNINPEGSMAGVIQIRGVSSAFFILSVQSYSDTFAGMLSWEPTIPRDLSALFPAYPAPVEQTANASTTASSTSSSTTTPNSVATTTFAVMYQAGFFDETVASHDARAYRDTQGRTLFIYSYANPSTLIFARNEDALTEILSRINTSRSK